MNNCLHAQNDDISKLLSKRLNRHFCPSFQGYQIPKGWNVIYSICDTHDVAEIFPNKDDFQPERFMKSHHGDPSRFQYIPFGGGSRMCVGKEFAKVLLKIFLVEVVRTCRWSLLNGPPTMKTGPTVYPVDNLPTKFSKLANMPT